MSDVKMEKKRAYRSPLREEQARLTRDRILDAALALFSTQGYGATSIAVIAREAGVVPETIYAALGSKRGIIDALIERAASPQVIGAMAAAWGAKAGDPAAQLGALAHFTTVFWVRNSALAAVFRQGTGDAEIGGEWAVRQTARHGLAVHLLGTWPDSVFRDGVDRDEAADVLWVLATVEVFHLFVTERGWTVERFEAWLSRVLCRELLGA
jgi:AcrR family transcriptional regulator